MGTSPRPVRYAAVALLLVGGLTACGQAQAPTPGASGTSSSGIPGTPPVTVPVTPLGTPPVTVPVTPPVTVPATGRMTLTGVPQAGVEASCVLLDRYVLVGGTQQQQALLHAGTTAGTPVTVTGHTDRTQMSYCQQGTLLVVDDVRAGT